MSAVRQQICTQSKIIHLRSTRYAVRRHRWCVWQQNLGGEWLLEPDAIRTKWQLLPLHDALEFRTANPTGDMRNGSRHCIGNRGVCVCVCWGHCVLCLPTNWLWIPMGHFKITLFMMIVGCMHTINAASTYNTKSTPTTSHRPQCDAYCSLNFIAYNYMWFLTCAICDVHVLLPGINHM